MEEEAKIIDVVDEEENASPKKKKKKKKVKLKKKKSLLFVILGIIVLVCFVVVFSIFYQKNVLKTIQKNYGESVVTTRKTNLYNKKKKNIGFIQKNLTLQLEKIKNPTSKNKFFPIKGTDYYISYKDVKKKKVEEKEVTDSYYLPSNLHIETKKNVDLLLDQKKVINLKNGIDTDIIYMDDSYYYIDFQGLTLSLKKNKNIKETQTDKVIENAADHVSVIHYENIDDNCGDDVCLRTASVKIHINKLRSEGYYFITKNDFISFLKGYRNLKRSAVLLTTSNLNDNVTAIQNELGVEIATITDEDGIVMQTTNKAATREDGLQNVNRYQAKRYTLIDEYSSMAFGVEVPDNGRQTSDNQSIAVMNYHFFYDESKGESCNESICLEVSKFREQLQWLQDNGYKTLTIKEFADWMDGLIEVPMNSVLLTIDDGAMGTGAQNGNILIPTLEEYKMHATLFLISGWWDVSNYQSPYLDVQSHTHDLHEEQSCRDGRGTFVCSDYETDKANLEASINALGDKTSFCFPFYSYDNESLQAISELGFRVAFIGGNVKAKRSDNHLLIPRYPILDDISLNGFINKVR